MNSTFICNSKCDDVDKNIILPDRYKNVDTIKIVMISEAPPINASDFFYESEDGAFFQTTKQAFNDADVEINNYKDFEKLGIYLTTAIKCRKLDYLVSSKSITECSLLYLEKELFQFPNLQIIMCMGDFAIKAVNFLFKKKSNIKPISTGSIYKIRNDEHIVDGIRFIPSYTQTGDSYNIEKSKRMMIAEDIRKALLYLK